jgi:lysine biosynthesis protein LysW
MSIDRFFERPLTFCLDCGGELDLTAAEAGDSITCVSCGSEWIVVSLDPPEVQPREAED